MSWLRKVPSRENPHHSTARSVVLPLLLHGDAAFAGQGVIAECLGLSGLSGCARI